MTEYVSDPTRIWRQRLLDLVLLGLAGPGFLFGLAMTVMWALGKAPATGMLAGLGVQPFYLLSYWLSRRGQARIAAFVPVLVLFVVMTGGSFQMGIGHATLIGYAMVTLTAGILIGTGAALLFALLSMGAHIFVGLVQAAGNLPSALAPEATAVADGIGIGLGLVVLVIFYWLSDREVNKILHRERELSGELRAHREELEQRVAERTRDLEMSKVELEEAHQRQLEINRQLEETMHRSQRRAALFQASAEVSRAVAQIRDLDQLLSQITQLINEHFGFYHVGIFFIDKESHYAVLRATNSPGGQRMLARQYKLQVGGNSIVGYVAGTGQPRISLDVGQDAIYFDDPDLPETRSEMALPLRVGNEIIGALDVQSATTGTFDAEDIAALATMADQIAIAIQNARLFQQTQIALAQAEDAHRYYLREQWDGFLGPGRARPGQPSSLLTGKPQTTPRSAQEKEPDETLAGQTPAKELTRDTTKSTH
jgi:putative methionine-R-sulfoxide reductase with GAF domain